METVKGKVVSVNGPIVRIDHGREIKMYELVKVGDLKLTGEVIEIRGDEATVQVYEETSGLRPGEPFFGTGAPLSLELGPGLLTNMYDGILRPLKDLEKASGVFIGRGISASAIDRTKLWDVKMLVRRGDEVKEGMKIAEVQETALIKHFILLPPGQSGKVIDIMPDGVYTVEQVIAKVQTKEGLLEVKLYQKWPVRRARPCEKRLIPYAPLVTGQRVIDTFFPISKGGTAAIPGGFGTGKTMTQHQLAKWSEADLIVYIGCGERGNEMTEVLEDFPKLIDPRSGKALMERTILIANTSNMPVAAREASIYTGITLAEYYRDMGYNIALMADSSSRWAEALRELSGRLEEIPAEEGFPAYLGTKLGEFYERAGLVKTLGGQEGSITVIGAVSPPGGDFSEPVTQNTKRFIRCFWGLDRALASARHYPAINWLESYSEYKDTLSKWFVEHAGKNWPDLVKKAMTVLQEEDELQQIVKLVGEDVLADNQKLVLKTARLIKVGYLQQAAFDAIDTYCTLEKQAKLLSLFLTYYEKGSEVLAKGAHASNIDKLPVNEKLIKLKSTIKNEDCAQIDTIKSELIEQMDALKKEFSA